MNELEQYLSILKEEYKSLREESKQASINMFSALSWGAAILGILISVGFSQWNKQHAVVLLIFFIVIPIISAIDMFLWLGEALRFKRVGDYICLIEQKVGMILDEFKQQYPIKEKWAYLQRQIEKSIGISQSSLDLSDPLAWEQWLRDMRGKAFTEGHLFWIYIIRLAFFPLIMLTSFLTGTYYVITNQELTPTWLMLLGKFIPKTKDNVLILMFSSILIIFISLIIAYVSLRKLNIRSKPFIRNKS